MQITQDLAGGLTLESITGYRKSANYFAVDLDFTPAPFIASLADQHDEQLSQEIHVSGSELDNKLRWTAGLYYFYSKDGWHPFDVDFGPTPVSPVPGVAVVSSLSNDQVTNSPAGYGQATYEVFDATNLTLGGRYTYERKTVDGTNATFADGAPISLAAYPPPGVGIPSSSQFDKFNYRIALDHKFGAEILGYVSYSTGFKSGGYNLAAAINPPYKPENIKATEVGLKSELLDRRLRLNVSVYNYLYDDIQVGQFQEDTEIIVNGAKAKMYGGDIDGELVVVRGLTLNGGFSYIHDRFLSYPNAEFIVPVAGCVPTPFAVCTGSAAGKELPYTPTTSFNVGGNYKWELPIGAFSFNANYYRQSKIYGSPDNVAVQDAYGLVNASITWNDLEDHLTLGLYGRNLGNTVYATSLEEATPGEVIARGLPRMYGVTAGYKF